MKIVKQKRSLSVRNLDVAANDVKKTQRHSILLPSSIRCIITGPSNCGKTNVMFSLLADSNGLRFENVYVYSKSLYQPKYQMLGEILKSVKGMGYYPFEDNTEIVDPSKAKKNSIFIFDDVACDKQDNIRSYFAMGRHSCVDCFYLSQTYARIPKHLVRDNANFLILFKQDDMNLRHIYNDHVNTDMTFDQFKSICSECWRENNYGFLVISKDHDASNGRYRKGFDAYMLNI